MVFREEWIHVHVLEVVQKLVQETDGLPGAVMEFGCWEGRSLVSIAEAAGDRPVHAVDHWEGNDGDEYTLAAVRERDIFAAFMENTSHLSNVTVHVMTTEEFMASWSDPISFLHLDADHRYPAVKAQIEWALPLLVPGGIMCGDDYSSRWPGVTQAVDEILPDAEIVDFMWVHRHD